MKRILLALCLYTFAATIQAQPDFLIDSDWLAYLQLNHLGMKDIRPYNGGWPHWGNELTLPVVAGEAPYSGDYEL